MFKSEGIGTSKNNFRFRQLDTFNRKGTDTLFWLTQRGLIILWWKRFKKATKMILYNLVWKFLGERDKNVCSAEEGKLFCFFQLVKEKKERKIENTQR